MASSEALTDAVSAAQQLGRLLTGTEAKEIADRLADGDTLTAALRVVSAARRADVRALLDGLAVGDGDEVGASDRAPKAAISTLLAVLHAIEGARSTTTALDQIWTMPGHLAQEGPLTSSVNVLVDSARQSVTCSTFNFQRSSGLWSSLRAAARRPQVHVRVYLDADAGDQNPNNWSPTTAEVASHLRPGIVLRTKTYDGTQVRNHAKFLAIDHRFLLVTSANFSWSAEQGNVEFGILIDNPNLADSVERGLRRVEDVLYERVLPD